ncbi:nucleoside deaminase [Bacillus sp. 165]|uniref:nucleoside deaminase n=1 Tax=Bacillus sp. 165 TaxID=1529117 RepID=UPI001AD99D17|nr:nucleoside deaminase [Bacillus sp. 165]MBO9130137.1 nucleoside deaminase [Bacillus sp. 165]
MGHPQFMKLAIDAAFENVKQGKGGPFGAVIVKDEKVIAVGTNEVTSSTDPTAHAEVQAIRKACQVLGDFQLKDCILYTSCEPCPMCLGAIYWARPKEIYYCFTREEAAHIGFDDALIYNEVSQPIEERIIPTNRLPFFLEKEQNPFHLWTEKQDKIEY